MLDMLLLVKHTVAWQVLLRVFRLGVVVTRCEAFHCFVSCNLVRPGDVDF